MEKVTATQMTELCEAVKAVAELHLIACKLCAEIKALRQDAEDAPDTREQLRARDKFLSKVHTNTGQLDALNGVLYCIDRRMDAAANTQPPGYRAALSDIRVTVETMHTRVMNGKPMRELTQGS